MEFKIPTRYNAIKNLIDDETVHIEVVKVDNGASEYCLKEETRLDGPMEFGTKKKNGGEGGDRKSLTYIELKTKAGTTRTEWEQNLSAY